MIKMLPVEMECVNPPFIDGIFIQQRDTPIGDWSTANWRFKHIGDAIIRAQDWGSMGHIHFSDLRVVTLTPATLSKSDTDIFPFVKADKLAFVKVHYYQRNEPYYRKFK